MGRGAAAASRRRRQGQAERATQRRRDCTPGSLREVVVLKLAYSIIEEDLKQFRHCIEANHVSMRAGFLHDKDLLHDHSTYIANSYENFAKSTSRQKV